MVTEAGGRRQHSAAEPERRSLLELGGRVRESGSWMCSVGEEGWGVADEAPAAGVGVGQGFKGGDAGLAVEPVLEDVLHRAVARCLEGQGAFAGRFQPRLAVGLGQTDQAQTLAQTHQNLSILKHLESPVAHRVSRGQKAGRLAVRGGNPKPTIPLLQWLQYADPGLAPSRRSATRDGRKYKTVCFFCR